MLYFWITTAVHRARHESGSTGSRFGSRPKGRMKRKNHFSSESSLDKMAGPSGSPGNGGSSSGSSTSGTMSPSKASSPSPLVTATAAVISYSRSSSGGSTTLPEKPWKSMCSKRKASTTSLTLWPLNWRKQKKLKMNNPCDNQIEPLCKQECQTISNVYVLQDTSIQDTSVPINQ